MVLVSSLREVSHRVRAEVRLRGPLAAVLWPLALGTFGNLVLRSFVQQRVIGDFYILHDGAVRLVTGGSVFADPFFLLTPSALFVVGPFGLLGQQAAFMVWNTLSVLAIPVAVVAIARFVGARASGAVGAAVLLGLSLSEGLTSTLVLGNLNNSLLLALGSAYLLAERRDRRVLAGVLLGACLAIKPVLVLVLLVPLFARRWRTVGWAIGVPAVLNVVGLALVPHRSDFFTVTVPQQLEARLAANSSLWAVGTYLGVPPWLVALARVVVLALAVLGAWRLRSHPDRVLALAAAYGLLVLAAFLVSSLGQGYYSLFLVPVLATAVLPGSPVRNPVAWVGAYACLTLDTWSIPQFPDLSFDYYVVHWTIGWLLLFAVLARWACARRRQDVDDAGTPVEARADTVGSSVSRG